MNGNPHEIERAVTINFDCRDVCDTLYLTSKVGIPIVNVLRMITRFRMGRDERENV